jgi:hypothetical protein
MVSIGSEMECGNHRTLQLTIRIKAKKSSFK